MKPVKTITSYTGLAQFIAELDEEPIGEITRIKEISHPYHYSQTDCVWNHPKYGHVFWAETRHRRYEVFKVPAGTKIHEMGIQL